MSEFIEMLQPAGQGVAVAVSVILCLVGVLLSCLTISGTWLVLAAAVILAFAMPEAGPGIWMLVIFTLLGIVVEVLEFFAGWLGICKRGGSKEAGMMSFLGGLIGMVLGSFIPVPVFGSVLGMLVGSFVMAYMVEKRRLQEAGQAANIAWGAVISRLLIVLLKVCVTLGMIIALAVRVMMK